MTFASLAATSNAAPPIAYAKVGAGNASEIWLVQPDGSGALRVYRGPSKVSVSDLDVRPGGGQIAFIEGITAIKVVTYNSAGVQQRVEIVPQPTGCRNAGLDFKADGELLFGQSCSGGTSRNVNIWDGSAVSTVIGNLDSQASKVRWLRDGSGFLWETATASGLDVRKSDLGNPSSWTVIWHIPYPTNTIAYFDVAHQSDAMLVSFGSSAQVQQVPFDFAGVGQPTVLAAAQDPHATPPDSQLLYRVQTHQGWNLVVKSGAAVKTIASGAGVTDWGN